MKRLILLFSTLLLGSVLFGLLISGIGWEEIWETLRTLSFFEISIITLLTAVFLGVGVFRWQAILRGQGHTFSFFALWRMYLAGFSLLFFFPFIPFASEVFRGSQLHKQSNVPLVKSLASVIIDRIFEVTSNLFVIIIGGVIFLSLGDSAPHSLKAVALIVFIVLWSLLLIFLYLRIFQRKSFTNIFWRGNGKEGLQEVEHEVFQFFHLKNRFFWMGAALSIARSFVGLARVWVIILAFGKGLALLPSITVLGFYYLAISIPIPAAFGSHDALQAVGFEAFSLGAGTGAAFAIVIRVAEAFFAVFGIVFALHVGLHVANRFFFRKER